MHNILLCQDLVKHYTTKNYAPNCLMKIDLCKAFDSLNWQFIKEMLIVLNFPHKFIKIIMTCITSISYVLLINGSPTPVFKVRRGIRQGDPLLSLLFVICMEYLSRLLKSVKGLYGLHPRCKTIKFSHLCFADDLMVFCKGDMLSIQVLCECIAIFTRTFGLQANSSKSALYTAGMPSDVQRTMVEISHFCLGTLPFTYLGVPLSLKRLSAVDCEKIADKTTSRIRTWQGKYLSYAARLQLINLV